MESKRPVLGIDCPEFAAQAVDGNAYKLGDFSQSRALLVAFICNHCPYVQAIEDRLVALGRFFRVEDLQIVGVCSNDATAYPEDTPEKLLQKWKEKSYGFPYLVDSSQKIARDFDAVCTPDLFLYDQARKLYYHGALDDSWKEASLVQEESLKKAIESLLIQNAPIPNQKPAIGCSIKWKTS